MKYFKYFAVAFCFVLTANTWADTLTVGLYGYVPRVEQFEKVIRAKWDGEAKLEFFSAWKGGYHRNPNCATTEKNSCSNCSASPCNKGKQLDVFVFDALFLNDYRRRGLLASLTANDINPNGLSDFVPYAIKGVKNTDNTYAGIPLLGCTNVLFYRKGSGIKDVKTFDQLRNVVKTCKYTGLLPGVDQHNGMMLNMGGGTTNASYYLTTQFAMNGKYPFPTPTSINANVIDRMRTLMSMSSYQNSTQCCDKSYQRGIWFGQGYGNSFVGFTESMWGIAKGNNNTLPDDFGFKPLPLWNEGEANNPVFYVDVIGVNAHSKNLQQAKKLARLMGSSEVVVASTTGRGQPDNVPQYLLLTLKSAFDTLGKTYPIYNEMKTLAMNPDIKMFTLSHELSEWVKHNKNSVRTSVKNGFKCGCDVPTNEIVTRENSRSICTSTCQNHDAGDWNGQWTTASPYVPKGYKSVCGCDVCKLKGG